VTAELPVHVAVTLRERGYKIKNPRPNRELRATCEHGTKASGRVSQPRLRWQTEGRWPV